MAAISSINGCTLRGALAVNAERIVLEAGAKTMRGFNAVTLTAATASCRAGRWRGTWTHRQSHTGGAALIGENGASQSIITTGHLTVASHDGGDSPTSTVSVRAGH